MQNNRKKVIKTYYEPNPNLYWDTTTPQEEDYETLRAVDLFHALDADPNQENYILAQHHKNPDTWALLGPDNQIAFESGEQFRNITQAMISLPEDTHLEKTYYRGKKVWVAICPHNSPSHIYTIYVKTSSETAKVPGTLGGVACWNWWSTLEEAYNELQLPPEQRLTKCTL